MLAALGPIGRFMVIIEPDNARVVADFHTLSNMVLAGLFLPLLTPYGNLLGQLMPALIKVAEPLGSFHADQAGTPVPREEHDRPMRPALRLKADPGERLVEVRPRLRESEQVRTSDVHQHNDVPEQADSYGRARLPPRDTVQHGADARQADARPGPSIREADARGNRVIIRECGPATGLPEVATGYVTDMMSDLAVIRLGPPDGGHSPDDDALPGQGGI